MQEPTARLLEHWHEFYSLIGTASAALVALLFVATSIGVGILSHDNAGPTRTYMSPIAFHFTSALFVSAIALVPSHTRFSLGLLVGLNAACGTAYAAFVLWRMRRDDIADLADHICYGVVPLAAYVIGLASAYLIFYGSGHAPEFLAGTTVLLLIVNIRNAWDLMLSLARRRGGAEASARPENDLPPTQ